MLRPEAKEKARETSERYRNTEYGKQHIKDHYTSPEYREKANAYQREYSKRPEVKLKLAMKRALYVTRNKLKDKARHVSVHARTMGRLVSPGYCEWCHAPAESKDLEMHHWKGYDPIYWLDVKFVHAGRCHLLVENISPDKWS